MPAGVVIGSLPRRRSSKPCVPAGTSTTRNRAPPGSSYRCRPTRRPRLAKTGAPSSTSEHTSSHPPPRTSGHPLEGAGDLADHDTAFAGRRDRLDTDRDVGRSSGLKAAKTIERVELQLQRDLRPPGVVLDNEVGLEVSPHVAATASTSSTLTCRSPRSQRAMVAWRRPRRSASSRWVRPARRRAIRTKSPPRIPKRYQRCGPKCGRKCGLRVHT